MKRIDQFKGLLNIFDDIFEHDPNIRKIFLEEIEKTHVTYLKYEVFYPIESIDYDRAWELLSRVEFLQETIKRYLNRINFSTKLTYEYFCGLGLIYELCSKILTVIYNNFDSDDTELNNSILESLLHTTFMNTIFYGCAGETAIAQIIANEYYKNYGEQSPFKKKFEFSLIEFLSIYNDSENFLGKNLNSNFDNIFHQNISPYITKCLNSFGDMLMNNYIDSQYFKFIPMLKAYFTTRDDHKNIRFLLPGQKETLEKLDSSQQLSNIVSLPTGGGKSLIAEIEICKTFMEYPNMRIIYIAPTILLCKQIEKDLNKRFNEIDDLTKVFVGIEYDEDEINTEDLILIMTPENLLLNLSRGNIDLDMISLIIFDEFHNIGKTDDRAINMQIIINLIKQYQKNKFIKFLLISAIISNDDQIAGRINGGYSCKSNLTISRKEIFSGGIELTITEGIERPKSPTTKDIKRPELTIIKDINKSELTESKYRTPDYFWQGDQGLFVKLKNPEKIMIFTGIKKNIKSKIQYAINFFGDTDVLSDDDILIKYAKTIFTDSEQIYIEALKKGIGFSNGGIDNHLQNMILDYYEKNILKIIVTTSTLLQGMNLDCEYLFCTEITYGTDILSKGDLLNLIGRTGRFPYQTDGYIFFHNTKGRKQQQIMDLTNENHSFPVKRGEYKEGFESEFEIFLYQRLIINNKSIQDIITLSDEEINIIIKDFSSILGEFFIDTTYYKDTIDKLVSYFEKRIIFLQNNVIDRRFITTGMNSYNSGILLESYKELLVHWDFEDDNINIHSDFYDVFPKSIISKFNNLTINKENFQFENIMDSIDIHKNIYNYKIPWILGCIRYFLTYEEDYMNGYFGNIEEIIYYWIYVFKYGCQTPEGYKLFKKYKKKLNLTVSMCEYLVSEGITIDNEDEEVIITLKGHDIYYKIFQQM